MRTVWKFQLTPGNCVISMPSGAEVLAVGDQGDQGPQLWARVDPDRPLAPRHFRVYGTGHELPEDAGAHLGTFFRGSLVFHVFAVREPF